MAAHALGLMTSKMANRLVIAAVLSVAVAEDAKSPHIHNGVFRQYSPGPPKKISSAFQISKAQEARLREGSKECTVTALKESKESPSGTMRCTTVLDIPTPPNIVWSLLLDFPRYPEFVGGITACKPYSQKRTLKGGKIVNARYSVSLSPMFKINYFLEHHYEPVLNSMAWRLDYSRRSDLFDSVGYWHVEAKPWGSRVYYTTDSLLPSWIPTPVRKKFTQMAMKASTAKLEPCCVAEQAKQSKRLRLPKLSLPELPGMPTLRMPGKEK